MSGSLGKSESDSSNQYQNQYGSQNQNQYGNQYSNQNMNQYDSANQYGNQNMSNFGQDIWAGQGGALSNMYGQQSGLFDQTNMQMQGQIPGAVQQQQGVFDAANPAWQQQMGGGAYQGMDLQGMYQNALGGGGNEQFIDQSIMGGAGNDYVDAMKAQMGDQSRENLGQSLAMNDLRANAAGQGGSSRHGMTESRLHQDANDRLGDQQTRLGFNTFDKDLDRKLGIAQRADQFDMGRLNNISGMMGGQQDAMQGGLAAGQGMSDLSMNQFNPMNSPWQMAGQYAGNLGGPTVLGQGGASGSGFGGGSSSGFGSGFGSGSGGGSGSGSSFGSGSGYGDSSAKGIGGSGSSKGGK